MPFKMLSPDADFPSPSAPRPFPQERQAFLRNPDVAFSNRRLPLVRSSAYSAGKRSASERVLCCTQQLSPIPIRSLAFPADLTDARLPHIPRPPGAEVNQLLPAPHLLRCFYCR